MGALALSREPAWRRAPIRCTRRVATSLARRSVPALCQPAVKFDEGRSRVIADLRTSLGLRLFRYGMADPEFDLTRLLLRPGDVFVDIGANIGLFSLVAAAKVGVKGRVLACEPSAGMRSMVERNARLNAFGWIHAQGAAVAEYSGLAEFVVFDGDGSGLSSFEPATRTGGRVEVVPVTTLDELVAVDDWPRVALIKVDVEGAEARVLHGGGGLIGSARPDLLIEVEEEHLLRQNSSVEELAELTLQAGYQAFRVLWDEHGRVVLRREDDWRRVGRTPNLFLTTKVERAVSAGVTCRWS